MDAFDDPMTAQKLGQAAEVVTRHLDAALEECTAAGLEREIFTAAVMATLMQSMQTALGSATSDALREMMELIRTSDGKAPN